MASARYTLNITPEPPREKHVMTKKEKWNNWWDYHFWHVVIGIIAVILVFMAIRDVVTQVHPDYEIGVMTQSVLPPEAASGLKTAFEALADDRNGDGQVLVQINAYEIPIDTDAAEVDPNTLMASVTRLMADGQNGDSVIFLTNEPREYADRYSLFAKNDGTTPTSDADLQSDFGYAWADCPVLTSMELGDILNMSGDKVDTVQNYLKDFYLFKRAYYDTSFETNKADNEYYNKAMELLAAATAPAA